MAYSEVTCGIFLYDSVNKRILCCRAFGHRKFERLSIPKGLFEEGKDEDYLDAAYREFEEETGVDLNSIDFIAKPVEFELVQYEKQNNKKLKAYFCSSTQPLDELNLFCNSYFEKNGEQFPEISEFHWLSLEEAKERLHPTQSILIPKILKLI